MSQHFGRLPREDENVQYRPTPAEVARAEAAGIRNFSDLPALVEQPSILKLSKKRKREAEDEDNEAEIRRRTMDQKNQFEQLRFVGSAYKKYNLKLLAERRKTADEMDDKDDLLRAQAVEIAALKKLSGHLFFYLQYTYSQAFSFWRSP